YPGQSTSYCLNQRIKDAAALGATVFVDIHFNTGGGTGAEVYYPNKSYNEGIHQEGQNLANKILSELSALGLTNR
ncbi:N-acetylmuramoyl-L-alanine amidase, partial [Thomasclavelia ramosa]